jgi:hypothetical protein
MLPPPPLGPPPPVIPPGPPPPGAPPVGAAGAGDGVNRGAGTVLDEGVVVVVVVVVVLVGPPLPPPPHPTAKTSMAAPANSAIIVRASGFIRTPPISSATRRNTRDAYQRNASNGCKRPGKTSASSLAAPGSPRSEALQIARYDGNSRLPSQLRTYQWCDLFRHIFMACVVGMHTISSD